MGKNFNKLLYSIIVLLFVLILGIKFFFKRQLPIKEDTPSKNKKEKSLIPKDEGGDNQVNLIKPTKKHTLIKNENTTSVSSDIFTYKGFDLKLKKIIDDNKAELYNPANGKRYKLTNKVFIRLGKDKNINSLQKKYQFKLIKEFNHLNLFYVEGPRINELSNFTQKLKKDNDITELQYEIIQRDPKTRSILSI